MGYADRFVADGTVEPCGYRQVFPVAASGVSIGEGRVALIQALIQNVRWRDDGVDPTAAVGHVLHAGESMWYTGNLRAIRFIEVASGAEVNIAVYK